MRFSEWLDEAYGQNNNRFQNYNARVDYGKGVEDEIFQHLRTNGMNLSKPRANQDKFDKIDAWWNQGKHSHPVQIKYRDTGDDILFEVYKDYQRKVPGRDMISRAKYYAVRNQAGEVNVFAVEDIKTIVNQMLNGLQHQGWSFRKDYVMNLPGGRGMLKLRPDPASGVEKVVAFIPPASLKPIPYGATAV
jgi:hypothetical protein